MSSKEEKRLRLYLEDAKDQLDGIENDFLVMEKMGANVDLELVNKIFRAIHSVKGGAAFLGLEKIKDLSHAMEDILNNIRSKDIFPSASETNTLLTSLDLLNQMLQDPFDDGVDISTNLSALNQLIKGISTQEDVAHKEDLLELKVGNQKESFRVSLYDLKKYSPGEFEIYILEIPYLSDILHQHSNNIEIIQKIEEIGFFIASSLDELALDTPDAASVNMYILFDTVLDPLLVVNYLNFVQCKAYKVSGERFDVITECPVDQPLGLFSSDEGIVSEAPTIELDAPAPPTVEEVVEQVAEIEPVIEPVEPEPVAKVEEPQPIASKPAPAPENKSTPAKTADVKTADVKTATSSTIRVNVDLLDNLMNLAGELVLTRNQLNQTVQTWDKYSIELAAQRLDLVTSELQESIMGTRMQPIGIVFSKFQRVVRDLSKKLNKSISFTTAGEDVELDKTIIENIGDPLTHLVRNAIDHGLEVPEDRTRMGKPKTGHLKLSAKHEAGHVVIEIIDDGKGIDANVLKKKALDKGLKDKQTLDEMSDKEAVKLVFTPGFSTAEQVTDLSGRGVGMDVVFTNLTKLGGSIDIDTYVGKGTTFRIKLPLTLAIIPSLLIASNQERFAIPQVNLVELVRISSKQMQQKLEKIDNSMVFRLRGKLLPIIDMNEFLGEKVIDENTDLVENYSDRDSINIVVVSAGEFQYGIIVDGLLDSEEIVVKPLGKHLRQVDGYAGATILGDGHPALIMDVIGVAKYMEISDKEQMEKEDLKLIKSKMKNSSNEHNLLVVENAEDEQFAIRLAFISRIERIRKSEIKKVGNKNVIQYRGGALPVFNIEEGLTVGERLDTEYPYLIVFSMNQKEVAIIVSNIVDIIDIDVAIDEVTFQEQGVSGSALIFDKITLILELNGLIKKIMPEARTPNDDVEISKTDAKKTILVVEDSKFFQNQIQGLLESKGLNVILADDGQKGYDTLYQNIDNIDMIMTDIEMPIMNGLEMVAKIRTDSLFSELPIVALTSVAGEDAIVEGKQAGVNEYLIKMDQDMIIEVVFRMLNQHEFVGV